jgi:hypothetical protein
VSDATTPRSAGFDAGPSTLFPLPSDLIAVTSDDCYTPRWVFDAMGLEFDLDVAAPPGGPWHVPSKRYYTAEDDGLVQPWNGVVWCNPPYSDPAPWCRRWAKHPDGCLLIRSDLSTSGPAAAFAAASSLYVPAKRLQFVNGRGGPTGAVNFSSVLLGRGPTADDGIDRLARLHGGYGRALKAAS